MVKALDRVDTFTGSVRPAGGVVMPNRPAKRDLTVFGAMESLVRHVLRV